MSSIGQVLLAIGDDTVLYGERTGQVIIIIRVLTCEMKDIVAIRKYWRSSRDRNVC